MSDDSFKRFLNEILQNAKTYMKTGIPSLGVPPLDPLAIGTISFGVDESYVNFKAHLSNLMVTGLSAITFNTVSFDSKTMTVTAKGMVPTVQATGQYQLDGKALYVIPLDGNGDITVNASAVAAQISMKLDLNLDMKKTKMEVNDVSFDFSNIQANVTGLEGGGDLGQVLNEIINEFGGQVLRYLQPILSSALENELQSIINDEISKLPNMPIPGLPTGAVTSQSPLVKAFYRPVFDLSSETPDEGNLNDLFDKILANVNKELADGYDPWKVDQDASTSFSKSVSMPWPIPDITIKGGAEFTNIEIYGLSQLVRTGPVTLSSSPPTLSFNIGTASSVHGGGDWKAWLHPVDVSGTGSVSISDISITGVIQIADKKGKIQSLGFARDPDIDVDITGLGPLTWIASQFTDAVTSVISPWLNDIVMPTVKDELQDQLDKFELPF